jgi:member of the syntaxin family of t-SNAREs
VFFLKSLKLKNVHRISQNVEQFKNVSFANSKKSVLSYKQKSKQKKMTSNIIPIPPKSASTAPRSYNNNNTDMFSDDGNSNNASDNNNKHHNKLTQEFESRIQQENAILDQLHASVMNTQDKAKRIGQEIKDQDPMLSRLGDNIDHSNMEIQSQQKSVMDMITSTKERSFWGTVAVLVLIIIVLLWI